MTGSTHLDERIQRALARPHTIDITTTGRRSGQPRRIELVFHVIDGMVIISGMPGRRDWYANLLADPRLTFHLKGPVQAGDRVRIFVLNAGPSIDSSFHVVGTIFSSVIKEGVHLAVGNPGNYGSQAVDLSPAQGAIIEMVMPEDGLYPMVTHAFNFVGRGALGLFQAGDGDPLN